MNYQRRWNFQNLTALKRPTIWLNFDYIYTDN